MLAPPYHASGGRRTRWAATGWAGRAASGTAERRPRDWAGAQGPCGTVHVRRAGRTVRVQPAAGCENKATAGSRAPRPAAPRPTEGTSGLAPTPAAPHRPTGTAGTARPPAPSPAPVGAAGRHTQDTHSLTHTHTHTHRLQCRNWLFIHGSVRGAHLLQKGSPRPRFQIGFMHNHTAGV